MFELKPINKEVYKYLSTLDYTDEQKTIISQSCSMDNVKDFLNEEFSLGNYNELIDLDKGGKLLSSHIQNNSKIIFVVDYDADGVTSGGISGVFMNKYIGYENYIIINNDREFGNGVNDEMVSRILSVRNVGLVVTADHGSSDDERYKKLVDANIDVLVTDHHLLPDSGNPVNTKAFINPQRDGGNFNTKISGCTVLFYLFLKTREYLLEQDYPLLKQDELKELLPFVALTIITDQMDMMEPLNRRLYLEGIRCMDITQGLWGRLHKQLGLTKKFTTMSINFSLGSLFNAAGRMNNAKLATDTQIASEERELFTLIRTLIDLNTSRKSLQNRLMGFADKQLKPYMKRFPNTLVSVIHEGYGVGGIIASSLGQKYNKPIFVFAKLGDELHGSGRGTIDGFNIKGVIDAFRSKHPEINIKGGGHAGAAGLKLPYKELTKFVHIFEEYTKESMSNLNSSIYYNLDIKTSDISMDLFNNVYKLDPYGNGFRPPMIKTSGTITKLIYIGKTKEHVIIKLNDLEIIFFSCSELFRNISKGDKVDVILTLGIKKFGNKESLSVVGEDIKKLN